MHPILQKIYRRLNQENLIENLLTLSGSELNSFLLELFRRRALQLKATQLLNTFAENRFVQPANLDPLKSKELELNWLLYARQKGFKPITLSPVSPLGSCAVLGTVSQNKVLSCIKGTEVVADATNVLALKIAHEVSISGRQSGLIAYASTHRHIRSQHFNNPNFTTHFAIFCMASGDFDSGNFTFELSQLNRHIGIILGLLKATLPQATMSLRFYLNTKNKRFIDLLLQNNQTWQDLPVLVVENSQNNYYQTVQFKIFIKCNEYEFDIADGGLVDWTQQLLGNKKHRLMISGVGLDLVQKLIEV